jgi:hypothetical protein
VRKEAPCTARVRVTIRDDLHCALKAEARRRHTTIGHLLDEILESQGVRVMALVERARLNAGLSEADALALAVAGTRAHRRP